MAVHRAGSVVALLSAGRYSLESTTKKFFFLLASTWPTPAKRNPVIVSCKAKKRKNGRGAVSGIPPCAFPSLHARECSTAGLHEARGLERHWHEHGRGRNRDAGCNDLLSKLENSGLRCRSIPPVTSSAIMAMKYPSALLGIDDCAMLPPAQEPDAWRPRE